MIVYYVTTWDAELQEWTPQIGLPPGPFNRKEMIERIIPALENMGYPTDPRDLLLLHDRFHYESAGSPCLNIEIMEVPG
jgi:hypothetical protein